MLHVFKVTDERLLVDGSPSAIRTMRGTTYYVNPNTVYSSTTNPFPGVDTHSGKSWTKALATMAAAFALLKSGDTIVFTGKVREQLITPVNIFDISVIGMGNRPHHADATPTGGQFATATWTTPASGATTAALCKVLQQGWRFESILFAGPSDHACLWFFRDDGAGDLERDASHGVVRGCRFASGQDGIWVTEVFDVLIEDNLFGNGASGFTGFAILGVAGSGVANPLMGVVRRNQFLGNTNHVKCTCSNWRIYENVFDDGGTPNTTVVLNVKDPGAGGGNNFVYNNIFQTATANFNTPDVVGQATDVWAQNVSIDSTAAGVGGNTEWGVPA
jgi:hypothetical protein